ncbi:MAG: hypothetical protein IJQ82_08305 [Selenomonadaceae bacterium]|nr:hypothetical protein [Selenomonadaceae bacterium]
MKDKEMKKDAIKIIQGRRNALLAVRNFMDTNPEAHAARGSLEEFIESIIKELDRELRRLEEELRELDAE